MSLVVGLTGGIGSGKSEVAKAFAMHAQGWEFIQAWTSHSSGDWLFFRRPRPAEPIDLKTL